MIVKINRLIEDKYQNEIKILKSRLANLTSQINSHFIFNTLEKYLLPCPDRREPADCYDVQIPGRYAALQHGF